MLVTIEVEKQLKDKGFKVLSPTQESVQEWLRDKHNIHVEIYYNASGCGYILTKLNGTVIKEIEDDIFYEDYYVALDKGIEEAFKLIP